jgi:hypothetical protein
MFFKNDTPYKFGKLHRTKCASPVETEAHLMGFVATCVTCELIQTGLNALSFFMTRDAL